MHTILACLIKTCIHPSFYYFTPLHATQKYYVKSQNCVGKIGLQQTDLKIKNRFKATQFKNRKQVKPVLENRFFNRSKLV